MRKILIVGANSYVGRSFENWSTKRNIYDIEKIGARNNEWEEISFYNYDVVIHVAAIAHIQETKKNRNLYYEVNRDLAYKVAKKAKNEGVKQFVFLSSMSVYGLVEGNIKRHTVLAPKNAYGESKLEAEKLISKLEDKRFKVAILRPPMVYGKNCKGNYQLLSKVAKKTWFFPDIKNQRSMIFIDNLSLFISTIIREDLSGVFFPQNKEYVETSAVVSVVSRISKRDIVWVKIFNSILTKSRVSIIKKVFGNLTYDMELSTDILDKVKPNQLVSFEDSIILSEIGERN